MDFLQSLSVGQVSGIIAVGTTVVTITLPMLTAAILISYVNQETTAATWSVVARQTHSSLWPTILRTDSAAIRHVENKVTRIGFVGGFLAILTAVAGIVTPLGLYEEVRATGTQMVEFDYTADVSTFGQASLYRPDLPLSRNCSVPGVYVPCPETGAVNATRNPNGWSYPPDTPSSSRIPESIRSFFTRNRATSTVAGIFDIQYRSWKRQSNAAVDNGEPYLVGLFRPIESLILRNELVVTEGIIVDLAEGGIGYRNHTLPTSELIAEWDEDILWLEPDVSCVPTNLSLKITGLGDDLYFVQDVHMVDEGGFAHITPGNPYKDWPNLTYSNPDVYGRAERTARLHNVLLAMAFNLTDFDTASFGSNVTIGEIYPLVRNESMSALDRTGLLGTYSLSPRLWAGLLSPAATIVGDDTLVSINGTSIRIDFGEPMPREDFPYYWSLASLRLLQGRCTGRTNDYYDDLEHNVQCAHMLPVPFREDGGSSFEEEAGAIWKTQINVCAAAVKASVKTVSFTANRTSLRATSVVDKMYTDESEYPMWAVEDWHQESKGYAAKAPLWGIVDAERLNTEGYNYTQSPHFYLPPAFSLLESDPGTTDDALAGTHAPLVALSQVFQQALTQSSISSFRASTYNGAVSLALRSRWEQLGTSPSGLATVIRLVWTDLMASYTIGSNSRLDSVSHGKPVVEVQTYGRHIAYRLPYGIPAIILLVLWLVLALMAALKALSYRPFAMNMRVLLNSTSVGRIAASSHVYSELSHSTFDAHTKTSKWLSGWGMLRLRLSDAKSVSEGSTQTYEQLRQDRPL